MFSGQSQRPTNEVRELVQTHRPPYWKLLNPALDDRNFVLSLKPTPILGRLWLHEVDGDLGKFLRSVQLDPWGEADRYADRLLRHPNADLVDAWESPNEPFGEMHIGGGTLGTDYDRFMAQFSRRILRAGKVPAIGNFGTGSWARTDLDGVFPMTAKMNPVLCLHEYGWPDLLSQKPRHALYHTRVSWPGDIWITELGVTNIVDGQGKDIGFQTWDDHHIPHYLFGNRKAHYRQMLLSYQKAATAQMAFIFGVGMWEGDEPPGWTTFEAGEVLGEILSGKKGAGKPKDSSLMWGDEDEGSNGPIERV